MNSKHGTAKTAEQFAQYLLEDLEVLRTSMGPAEIEKIVVDRLRDLLSNAMVTDPRRSDAENAVLMTVYKKIMGNKE